MLKNITSFLVITQLTLIGSVQAQPLKALIPSLLQNHDKIKAAKDEFISKEYGLESSEAAWQPTLDLNLEYGHEIKKKVASETEYGDAFQRKVTLK